MAGMLKTWDMQAQGKRAEKNGTAKKVIGKGPSTIILNRMLREVKEVENERRTQVWKWKEVEDGGQTRARGSGRQRR